MADEENVLEFLETLEDYSPLIPDDLTSHLLHRSGFHSPSLHVTRLVSLSAHKFLAEVISDAMQYYKMRQAGVTKDPGRPRAQQSRDKRPVLTNDDLAAALREYGLNVKKPAEYFVDGPLVPQHHPSSGSAAAAAPPPPAPPSSPSAAATATVTVATAQPIARSSSRGQQGGSLVDSTHQPKLGSVLTPDADGYGL